MGGSEIQRFRHIPDLHDEPHAKLVPDADGHWVRHSDHEAALAKAREERDAAKQAQRTGKLSPDDPVIKAQDADADCGCEPDSLPSEGQGGER